MGAKNSDIEWPFRHLASASIVVLAYATVLGKLYSQRYAESLGIPESDLRIEPVAYAIASPDIALLAAAMWLAIITYPVCSAWIRASIRHVSSLVGRWAGPIFMVSGFLLVIAATLSHVLVPSSPFRGLMAAVAFALALYGGSFMGAVQGQDIVENAKLPKTTEARNALKHIASAAVALIPILALIACLYASVNATNNVAESDSTSDRASARHATITDKDGVTEDVRVVSMGRSFVYVLPPKDACCLTARAYEDVASIDYSHAVDP